MNAQQTRPQAGTNPATNGQKKKHRKPPAKQTLMIMRASMAVLCALIFLLGLLLIVLPMFRVKSIEVEGNSFYSDEEILASAGIELGDEILALDTKNAIGSIYEGCENVKQVKLTKYLFKVRITVSEYENVLYTEHNGKFYTLSSELRVLGEHESLEELSGFLPIKLPALSNVTQGQTVGFASEGDMSYINTLLDTLIDSGTLVNVSALDCSEKYRVSYVLSESVRVELGKVDKLEAKLDLANRIIERKTEDGICSVVNVSDLQKPTYRPLDGVELLAG